MPFPLLCHVCHFVCLIKVEVYSYSIRVVFKLILTLDHHSMFALVYNTCMYKHQARKADGYH